MKTVAVMPLVRSLMLFVPVLAILTPELGTQNPPPQNPPATPPAGVQPSPRGGRGRGGVQIMALSTSAWPEGGTIPQMHTQRGEETSPPLSWSDPPDGTASFVLIVHDLNAATGNGIDDFLHWLVWNIPATARSLPAAVPQGPDLPDGSRQISASGPYYRGPAASATGPPHHYVFELFALDTMLDVPAVGATPAATRAAVIAAMAGHVRGKGVLLGLYKQ